jgi:hypothetical protein
MTLFGKRRRLAEIEEEFVVVALEMARVYLKALVAADQSRMEFDRQERFAWQLAVGVLEGWSFRQGAFYRGGIPITRPENFDSFAHAIFAVLGADLSSRYGAEFGTDDLSGVCMRAGPRVANQLPELAKSLGLSLPT